MYNKREQGSVKDRLCVCVNILEFLSRGSKMCNISGRYFIFYKKDVKIINMKK